MLNPQCEQGKKDEVRLNKSGSRWFLQRSCSRLLGLSRYLVLHKKPGIYVLTWEGSLTENATAN